MTLRKLLLAGVMVLIGLASPVYALSLDDITFSDLDANGRNAYYTILKAPCSVLTASEYNAEQQRGIMTAVVIRWRLLTDMQITNDDGYLFGIACGVHPDFTVDEMIEEAVGARKRM
jgi:hypothetical protein